MENWNGFELERFVYEDAECLIVYPKAALPGNPYAMKTEYWDAFPAVEIALLEKGFHLVYRKNFNRLATPEDCHARARLMDYLTETYRLSPKCVPVGYSCGGAHALNFAKYYPEKVACLYIDAPVVNFMSWPCHFGQENPKPGLGEILPALGLKNLAELMAYRKMPLDKIPSLIEKKIPLVMASGDSDTTVPYDENGLFVERAYKEAALPIEVYIKPGGNHHPHGIPDPTPIVDFILRYDI